MQPLLTSQLRAGLYLKVLIYGPPGVGKTTWSGGAPRPLFAACETGIGHGLLPLADRDVGYVPITSLKELDEFIRFAAADTNSETIVLDSVTAMVQTFIRAAALAIPRKFGDTDKRRAGVPELDDYGVMGELLRQRIHRLLDIPGKHVILTALSKFREADAEKVVPAALGPMLPGQAFEAVPGMVDHAFYLEAKRRVTGGKTEHYRVLHTASPGVIMAKTRISGALPPQLVWDGTDDSPGSFTSILHALRAAKNSSPPATAISQGETTI